MYKLYMTGTNAYANNPPRTLIYDDSAIDESNALLDAVLTMEENSAGKLEFTIPPTHSAFNYFYDEFRNSFNLWIDVEKEGNRIWCGRVISSEVDFWKCIKVTCEGLLTVLNDSIIDQRYFENVTPRTYLQALLEFHNTHAADFSNSKKILLGNVTIGGTATISESNRYTDYESILNVITEKLVKPIGGHIQLRYDTTVTPASWVLDWLAEYNEENAQQIELGVNLFDFSRTMSAADYCTQCIPRGKKKEKAQDDTSKFDEYTTVASVNGGSIYVTLESGGHTGAESYGVIDRVVDFNDIDNPAILLTLGRLWLADKQFTDLQLEISAMDMHYAGAQYQEIKLGDSVRVVSPPHNMNKVFPVTKMEIKLNTPEDTLFTLGQNAKQSFTSSSRQSALDLQTTLSTIPSEERMTSILKREAGEMIGRATTGYINIIQNSETGAEELVISSTPDYLHAPRIWRWTMKGLGYSNNGYNGFDTGDYEVAITEDGRINADLVSVGTLVADLIKAGVLTDQSANHNFWFNMATGEYYIRAVDEISDDLTDVVHVAELTTTANQILSTVSSTYQTISNSSTINLIPSYYMTEYNDGNPCTRNGITFTVNPDGSIKVNGTADGDAYFYLCSATSGNAVPVIAIDPSSKYTISGCPEGGSTSGYRMAIKCTPKDNAPDSDTTTYLDTGSGRTIPIGYWYACVYIRVTSGTRVSNQVFKPMLEKGDTKHAFQSPRNGVHAIEQQVLTTQTSISQTADAIRLEASETYAQIANVTSLNLIPSVYSSENSHGSEWTTNGITFVTNPDGSVTATGTATANAFYYFNGSTDVAAVPRIVLDEAKSHTLSGAPPQNSGSYSTTYALACQFWKADGTYNISYNTNVNGNTSITRASGYKYAQVYIRIVNGYSCPSGGLTFYPMLEQGGIMHSYQSNHLGGDLNNRVKSAEAAIEINAHDITLRVSQTDYNGATIASKINQSASSVVIEASHISLAGKTIDLTGDVIKISSTKFNVTKDGVISATGGTIGGFTIDGTSIRSGALSSVSSGAIGMCTENFTRTVAGSSRTDLRFAIGTNFGVSTTGKLYCANAYVKGEVEATTFRSANAYITGGQIEVSTSSEQEDYITLRYGNYSTNMSPRGLTIQHVGSSGILHVWGNSGISFISSAAQQEFAYWQPDGDVLFGNANEEEGFTYTASSNRVTKVRTAYGDVAQTGRDLTSEHDSPYSVSSASWSTLTSVQVPTTGTWLLIANFAYSSLTTASGYRHAVISEYNAPNENQSRGQWTPVNTGAKFVVPGVAREETAGTIVVEVKPSTANKTYYLNVYHTAGQTLTTTGTLKAIRIA